MTLYENHDDLCHEAIRLIWPYLHLSNRTPDCFSPRAREDVILGIGNLLKCERMQKENWQACWLIGKAYEALGNFDQSYCWFKRSYEYNVENKEVARELMHSCLMLHKTEEAVTIARFAVKRNPDDSGLMSNLGLALLYDGQVDDALATTRNALSLDPYDSITRSLLEHIEAIVQDREPGA